MRLVFLAIVSVFNILSAGAQEAPLHLPEDIQKEVVKDLKDPDSATFRQLSTGQAADRIYYCGELNAKNSYGGYIGFKRFVYNGKGVMIWGDSAMRSALGDQLFEKAFERNFSVCNTYLD